MPNAKQCIMQNRSASRNYPRLQIIMRNNISKANLWFVVSIILFYLPASFPSCSFPVFAYALVHCGNIVELYTLQGQSTESHYECCVTRGMCARKTLNKCYDPVGSKSVLCAFQLTASASALTMNMLLMEHRRLLSVNNSRYVSKRFLRITSILVLCLCKYRYMFLTVQFSFNEVLWIKNKPKKQ